MLQLVAFVKTSGGSGLHVFVPIKPEHTFEEVRMWVRTVAQHMAMQYPAIFRANYGREEAGKRILIDNPA